ncbi:MAG: nucleotidyltransferase domain-containing protein [archaeon]
MQLLEEIRRDLTPDDVDTPEIGRIIKKISSQIKKGRIRAVAVTGGSIAKGTFLKQDHDVDIFVKFDYAYKDRDISAMLKKIVEPLKPVTLHGSRDYFTLKKKYNYEIVPVLDIKDPSRALNVTDMSPMHVSWVRSRIKDNPGLAGEIRLAKAFCKGQGVYGAESYIRGFSGHVLDILVIYCGGFLNLLRASLRWKPKQVIDINRFHKGRALDILNTSKTGGPLVVVDPILPDRNAAAALGSETFERFREAARRFLREPSKSFFHRSEISETDLEKKAAGFSLIHLTGRPHEGKEDIVGCRLLKVHDYIVNQLSRQDFNVRNSAWQWDKKNKADFYFITDRLLSRVRTVTGPLAKQKLHCDKFRKKHGSVRVRGGRLYATDGRKYRRPEELVKDLVKGPYLTDKIIVTGISSNKRCRP